MVLSASISRPRHINVIDAVIAEREKFSESPEWREREREGGGRDVTLGGNAFHAQLLRPDMRGRQLRTQTRTGGVLGAVPSAAV